MDIKELVKIIETERIFIYPYLMKKPNVDKSVLPHFIPKMGAYQMGKVSYNKYTPNVYITLRIEGTVVLDAPDNKYDSEFDTFMFLQYPLFKLGKPVTPKNKVIVSGGSKSLEPIRCSSIAEDGVYEIDLNKVTFDSFKQDKYSANILGKHYKTEFMLKCAIKAYKHFTPEPPKSNSAELLQLFPDKEYVDLLNKNKINDGGFHPKYYGKSPKPFLEFKVAGCSHVPKVDDVINRLLEKKKQTTAGEVMRPFVEFAQKNDKNKIIDKLATAQQHLDKIDTKIRETNWGIFLSEGSLMEFEGREDNELLVGDTKITVKWNE